MNYETAFDKDSLIGADEPDAETVRKRRRLLIALVLVTVIAVAALVAYRFVGGRGNGDGSDKSQVALVTVAVPGQQAVTQTANATGSLDARVDMPVGVLGEGGRVEQVLVQPGDWVRKGQPLLVIERAVQVQQISSLAAQLEVAKANAKLAQNNLDRANSLVADGSSPRRTSTRRSRRAMPRWRRSMSRRRSSARCAPRSAASTSARRKPASCSRAMSSRDRS